MPEKTQTIHVKVSTANRSAGVKPITARGSVTAKTVFRWVLDGTGGKFQTRLLIPGGAFMPVSGPGGVLPQTVFRLQDEDGKPVPVELQAAARGEWRCLVSVDFEEKEGGDYQTPSVVPIVIIDP